MARRPPSSSRSRLGTSAGGRRPMTATNPSGGRPTTANPQQQRITTGHTSQTSGDVRRSSTSSLYDREHDGMDEEDEEDEEEDDDEDEDVFAFVPPHLGPAPQVIHSDQPSRPISQQQQQRSSQQQQQQPQQQPQPRASSSSSSSSSRPPSIRHQPEETFYFDEATGAVYDAQGKLVQMPQGFDPAPLTAPRPDTDPVERLHSGQDQQVRDDQGGGVRQRNNRLSYGADGPHSPASHIKNPSYPSVDLQQPQQSPLAHTHTHTQEYFGDQDYYDDYQSSLYNQNLSGNKLARYSSDLGGMPTSATMAFSHDDADFDTRHLGGNASRNIKMVELEMEGDEDSPYPEVRASVSNVDDTEMSANTLRMWILAFLLATFGSAVNQVLTLRYPAPILTALIVQVVAYPLGKLMAATLPITDFQLPSWLGGSTWSLNPGMFNIKEHTAVVMMGNCAITPAYALNTVLIQDSPYYYNDPKPIGFAILLTLSSQLLGLGLAGYGRRFLVTPASMIWPQVLVYSTVFNTLHAEEDGADGSMSRFKYFVIVVTGAFVWWWFPGWIFTALSTFSFLCWIWPNSFPVNTLFGTSTGMGMSFLTFDWQLVSYTTSPLVTPWWAQCNIFAGFVFFLWLVAPILYWTNTYNFGFLPFSASQAYDRFGAPYDVRRILNPDSTLNEAAYESFSQLYFGTTYYIVYWTGFAAFTSVLVHTVLYHGRSIWRGVRGVKTEEDDVHAKLMRKYKHVPDWWYMIPFAVAIIMAIINAEVYDTGLPVWGVLLCIVIPTVYYLPSGFIYAQTGASIGVNLISELVAGYVLPSKSLPNMMIKLYSQAGLSQAFVFSQDLKLAHYMKIDPRLSFAVMLVGAVWSAFVQIFVNLFMRKHVPGICLAEQEHQFTCPQAGVYFTSSIIWGVIGPERLFSNGSYYSSVYWAQLVGAILPIPVFFLSRRWPTSFLKVVNVPLIFTSTSSIPPAGGIVVSSWFLTGFIFQYLLRKKNFRWWSKYNFITSAAMDTGTILSAIMIFLTLTLPRDGKIGLSWWGNEIQGHTLDGAFPQPARMQAPIDGFAPPPQVIHAQ
ncbi:unnamed protein product [Sympodiomycopsis kandeliae]